jgi:two-component system, chemotaxis family, protein-glutamate methylesterase/glutaminase
MIQPGASSPGTRPLEMVAIGGSTGAIDGLCTLLPMLPPGFEAPIAVVVHLPRHRRSALATVLAGSCPMPVREPEDKEPLHPGTVYVAPADYHLMIDRGPSFSLSTDEPENFSMPSIDVLFDSAARIFGSALAGVVLSGANADGATGLRAIVDAGGVALIQTPAEAEFAAMPEAARRACPSAEVLGVAAISEKLLALRPMRASW